jgi:hypothetical protein
VALRRGQNDGNQTPSSKESFAKSEDSPLNDSPTNVEFCC